MEAGVATSKEVKNLYQLKLMHMMSFVKDDDTYNELSELIRGYMFGKLRDAVSKVEEEKGYTAETYQDLLDGKIQL